MIFVRTQQRRVSKLAGEESQSGWLGRQDAQLIEQDDGSAAYDVCEWRIRSLARSLPLKSWGPSTSKVSQPLRRFYLWGTKRS